MDLEQSLKRIRAQIRYSRISGVEESLASLLARFKDTIHEADILKILVLDYLPIVCRFSEAVPLLDRLLSLEITAKTRIDALGFRDLCIKRLSVVASEASLDNPNLNHFMTTLRTKEFFEFNAHPNSLHRHPFTRELEVAKMLAWNQGIEIPFESWNGLRSKASRQRNKFSKENLINTDLFHHIVTKEITALCEERITGEMMNFFDDIEGDLTEIAEGKAVGYESSLHKQMWEVYKKRAFPCGWKADSSQEKLCVFIP